MGLWLADKKTDLSRLANLQHFKQIHMTIRPAERDLQDLVKLSEGVVSRDRKETGDCRVGSTAEAGEKEVIFLGRSLRGFS
jgi:hypothetical protein